MTLFELMAKISFDSSQYDKGVDSAKSKAGELASKIGSGLKTAAKIGTAAISAAAAGITALTKASIENYAEYEQLVGGAQLMFGKAFDTVQKNAQNAYKTVQMSQNEYLQQVNGLATGLKTALNGDEQAAAELSHRIIKAEADIVAATGNAAENVQNAFNGIMKSNFTMLDNLQIGIKPTKEGFQEVIDKVNEWKKANGEATDYQMGNLADMQSALVDYIEMVGMSDYATNEAAKTISGSLASMKSAWSNLVTGVADDEADFDMLINNFVDSIGTVAENILPRVEIALGGVANLVDKLVPVIVEKVPSLIESVLPKIANSAVNIVDTFLEGVRENNDAISNTVMNVGMTLVSGLGKIIPDMIQTGAWLLESLMDGIASNTPQIVTSVSEMFDNCIGLLTDLVPELLVVGADMLLTLAQGLSDGLPEMIPKLVEVITWIAQWLVDPFVIGNLVDAGITIILALAEGIIKAVPTLLENIPTIIENIITSIVENVPKLFDAAKEMVVMFVEGIKEHWAEKREETSASFTGFIDDVRTFFSQKLPEIINNIGQWFSELPEKIAYWLGFAIGKIAEWGQNAIEWVKTEVPKIIENIVTFFSELPDKIKTWLTETITKITDWISNTKDTVVKKVPEIINKITEFFEELPEKIKEIGKNIVNGLYEGIKNAWSNFTEKITGMFDNFVQGIKDGLGIHSPSRVFSEMGKNMALGLGVGWDDEFSTIKKQIDSSLIFDSATITATVTGTSRNGAYGSVPVTNNFYGGYTERDGAKIARSINRQLGLLV